MLALLLFANLSISALSSYRNIHSEFLYPWEKEIRKFISERVCFQSRKSAFILFYFLKKLKWRENTFFFFLKREKENTGVLVVLAILMVLKND